METEVSRYKVGDILTALECCNADIFMQCFVMLPRYNLHLYTNKSQPDVHCKETCRRMLSCKYA